MICHRRISFNDFGGFIEKAFDKKKRRCETKLLKRMYSDIASSIDNHQIGTVYSIGMLINNQREETTDLERNFMNYRRKRKEEGKSFVHNVDFDRRFDSKWKAENNERLLAINQA